ncbi:hypothetical protein F4V90_03200 [Neorhizobium galegae]|nr:hypothetical protein F4V90_03200 [Neorhizobium galegae]
MSDTSSIAWFGMTRLQLVNRLRLLACELEETSIPANHPLTRIDQWTIAQRAVPCLIGVPTSHPTISDGEPLFSSELYFLDPERCIARTFSRWYELGEQAEAAYWNHRYPRQQ